MSEKFNYVRHGLTDVHGSMAKHAIKSFSTFCDQCNVASDDFSSCVELVCILVNDGWTVDKTSKGEKVLCPECVEKKIKTDQVDENSGDAAPYVAGEKLDSGAFIGVKPPVNRTPPHVVENVNKDDSEQASEWPPKDVPPFALLSNRFDTPVDGEILQTMKGLCNYCRAIVTCKRDVSEFKIVDALKQPHQINIIGCPHCIERPGYLERLLEMRGRSATINDAVVIDKNIEELRSAIRDELKGQPVESNNG